MKKWIIIISSIVLIVAAILYYVFIYAAQYKRNINDEKAIAISAVELVSAYNNNESEANTKYLNQALLVEGFVKEVGQNQEGNTTITIDGANDFSAVFCTLKEANNTVEVNKKINIKGVCIGFTSDVVITDAFIQIKN
ncbi:OB-fold protein [Sediminibacterium sp.]|uniref:OB-fold protein n=1 Tax=Sediminibacterium sp. TaxID=1917865 RepID=UPI003F6FF486